MKSYVKNIGQFLGIRSEGIMAQPLQYQRTLRHDEIIVGTTSHAGKCIPIAYAPLFREDQARGSINLRFKLSELAEPLMNAVQLNVYAHFVPKLAFERFNGPDQFDRSYMGVPETEGGDDVVPFFETANMNEPGNRGQIIRTMGLHGRTGAPFNKDVLEAYNAIWNYRARERSTKIELRDSTATSVAPAFWRHAGSIAQLVPDYDQASMDGEVPIEVFSNRLPVTGAGLEDSDSFNPATQGAKETGGNDVSYDGYMMTSHSTRRMVFQEDPDNPGYPNLYANMPDNGLLLSLANIEAAKKTAWFATQRQKYKDYEDDHIIDLNMQGIAVPQALLSRPILLDRQRTIFGYNQRYATDSGNLDKSVSDGMASVDLGFYMPRTNCGGIIMITAEIVPEILWERQRDYYLTATSVDDLPNAQADEQDPEHVEVIKNEHLDVDHESPTDTLGYMGGNQHWNRSHPRLGGMFYKGNADGSFDEDRLHFWTPEIINPEFTEDFYLATNLSYEVFADTTADNVEVFARGMIDITGNTVFGKRLKEDTDDFEKVSELADYDRIDQEENSA